MTIGMLLNAPYPSDVRVKKETDALLKAGFKIHLLCLRQANEAYDTEFEGIHITRIDGGTNNYHLAFWDVVMSVTFVHPKFKKSIPAWVRKNGIKAIHVHDLPLAGTALKLRKELRIPVVVDFHENYPEALKTWFEWKTNPIARLKNKMFMNPSTWEKHERFATLNSDRVIAVVDEMKQRLIHDHNVDPKRVTVITNSEGKNFLDQPIDENIYNAHKGKFIVTYSGNIGPHRGVDTAILAMKHLKDQPDIQLLIIGSGSKPIMDYLNKLVNDNDLSSSVYFFGRQPFQKFYSFMKFADANIIPHKSNGHTDNTVPHKLFQAMMVGKPVIVSSSAPLRRIVNYAKSGVVFEAGNELELAKVIRELHADRQLQKQLGENGLRATTTELNWENDQKVLIALYQDLIGKS